jgi:hypothetical protein
VAAAVLVVRLLVARAQGLVTSALMVAQPRVAQAVVLPVVRVGLLVAVLQAAAVAAPAA